MAFHVGCPITCKRICYCTLGAPRKNKNNVDYIAELQHFLKDPWLIRVRDGSTVQVPVPPPPPTEIDDVQVKRVAAVQKTPGQEVARRFDSAAFVSQDATRAPAVKELGSSNGSVMCLLCFSSEIEGSENAMKMLPCTCCGKRYHKQCVTKWSQHRDLFHWSSWKCPPCRTCEVCRRTGEHNKFKFCKRCDGAIHCYCMQPPHKNVSSGPYLCSKHTKCHSCGSNVPGNGLSVRWFLGYTCCDACGRLFTKGNYCPACLKVYRDSEATPMVCCDICQRWVHIQCDGISDEIYLQFQIDGNLPYTCPTCRGEYSQIRSLDDAVHELWKRRDEEDRDLIANLRAAAGLPTEEDIFSISPFSDDEDNGPITINWRARLAMKTSCDLSPKKIKESGKKSSSKKHGKKKEHLTSTDDRLEVKSEEYDDPQLTESRPGDKNEASHQPEPELFPSQISESVSPGDIMGSNNEQEILKHKLVDEVTGNNVERRATVKIKSKNFNDTGAGEDMGPVPSKPKTIKGTKLVIHLGGRNKAITNSPKSDSSSYQKEQDVVTLSGGNEAMSKQRIGEYPLKRLDVAANSDDGLKANDGQEAKGPKPRDRNIIRLGKGKSEASGLQSHRGNGVFDISAANNVTIKKSNEVSAATEGLQNNALKSEEATLRNNPDNQPDISGDKINTANKQASLVLHSSLKDSRPLLKLKFKTPYQGSWAPITEEERVSVKGQRSKRKRPSSLEKPKHHEPEGVTESQDGNLMNEIMDANWILKKLGKDAIGKRVEVHQPTDDSWNKGVVSDVFEGTSKLSIELDDGRAKTLELGKQGIRFVTDREKRLKT